MTKNRDFMRPTAKEVMITLVTLGALAALLAFVLYTVPEAKKAMEHRQQQVEEMLKY